MITPEEKIEEIHKAFDELLQEVDDSKRAIVEKGAALILKAKDLGKDLISDKSEFLAFLGRYGDTKWQAGLLEPIDDKIIAQAINIVLTVLAGKDWFEKMKAKAEISILADGRVIEPTPSTEGNA